MDDGGACRERELVAPVDECRPDGSLSPEAHGWSRHPLHRGNLRGRPGRKKRWDYWCVTTDECALALTIADIDYLGLASAWFLDFATGRTFSRDLGIPGAPGFRMPQTVGGGPVTWKGLGLEVAFTEQPGGTRLVTSFRTRGVSVRADVLVARPTGHETLTVCVPWNERTFQVTSKHNTRPAEGEVRVGNQRWDIGPGTHGFGCLDWGRGVWPYRITWNWGSASGVQSGRTVGLQLGGKWTDGTGATENALCIDGVLSKLSEELVWEYVRGDWERPWRITTPVSDRVDLTFTPFHVKAERVSIGPLGTDVHQCFGRYSGSVIDDAGDRIAVRDLLGWAEEARMRW